MQPRITYLGREIQPRRPNGRYKRTWMRTKRTGALLMIALGAWFIFGHPILMGWFDKEISYVAPIVLADITMEAKVEAMKDDILNRLMNCERAGHSEEDGIIIFDSNNEPSVGQFQFQRDTVRHYYKKLYGQEITRKEAVMIALDTEKARQLAHDIIWQEQGGIFNWQNCADRTGVVPEISVIKKLVKS